MANYYDWLKDALNIYDNKNNYSATQYDIEHNADGTRKQTTYNQDQYEDIYKAYNPNAPEIDGVQVKADYIGGMYSDEDKAKLQPYVDSAKQSYDRLSENGYAVPAQNLKGMSSGDAYSYIRNTLMPTMGKTSVQEYIIGQLQGKGLSREKAMSLVTTDPNTGEVSLAGKKLNISDGTNYNNELWTNNTGYLDDEVDIFSQNYNVNPSLETQHQTETARQFKTNSDWDKLVTQNPAETDFGKYMLQLYGLNGNTAARNAMYSRAAANGGVIDSIAASDAVNARNSSIGQGMQSLQDWYKSQIDAANSRQAANDASRRGVADEDSIFRTSKMNEDKTASDIRNNNLKTDSDVDVANRTATMQEKLTDQSIRESNDALVTNASKRTGVQQLTDMQANNPYMVAEVDANGVPTGKYTTKETGVVGGYMQMFIDAQNKYTADCEGFKNATTSAERARYQIAIQQDLADMNNIAMARNNKTGTSDLPIYSIPNNEAFSNMLEQSIDASIVGEELKGKLDQINAEAQARMMIDNNTTANNMKEADFKNSLVPPATSSSGSSTGDGNDSGTVVTDPSKITVKQTTIDNVAKGFIQSTKDQYPEQFKKGGVFENEKVLIKTGTGKYKVSSSIYAQPLITYVANSKDIPDAEKAIILKDCFGISDEQLSERNSDRHYKN